ncbi:hypothetical protein KL864_29945 [Mycolicibacterium goodii]|uniref:hypothetical protein n=1 Tax=Mycolicibacterium goodii TaxID=134601 RepID=UPI001BDD4D1A|nr:hypothetical protein [Mycolicibacterium goodii]MBU8820109.1 hypothetical protein [Mycolicibacterium goodii]
MSDTQDTADDAQPAPFDFSGIPETTRDLQPTYDWFALPDAQLQRMSYWADIQEEGIGITLAVPGGLICGTIVSTREFHTGVSTRLQELIDVKGDEKQSKGAKDYAEFFFDEPAERSTEFINADRQAFADGKLSEPRHMMTRYIHLKDSWFSVPGQQSLELGYARILLSQVTGWTVGTFR